MLFANDVASVSSVLSNNSHTRYYVKNKTLRDVLLEENNQWCGVDLFLYNNTHVCMYSSYTQEILGIKEWLFIFLYITSCT